MAIARLDDREREAVRGQVESECARFAVDGGYQMSGVCINALTS